MKVNVQTKAATVLARGLWGAKALAWSQESSALVYSYGTRGDCTLAALLVDEATVEPRSLAGVGVVCLLRDPPGRLSLRLGSCVRS